VKKPRIKEELIDGIKKFLDSVTVTKYVNGSWKTYLLGTLIGLIQSSISPRKKKLLV